MKQAHMVSALVTSAHLGANDFTNFVVGADYKLAAGLTPYIEASFFDYDQGGTPTDNNGTVVLVGTQLNF